MLRYLRKIRRRIFRRMRGRFTGWYRRPREARARLREFQERRRLNAGFNFSQWRRRNEANRWFDGWRERELRREQTITLDEIQRQRRR